MDLPVLGPAQVWYGPPGAEVELGKTHGGVHIYHTETETEIFYDQVGTSPWDGVITGALARVEADFANLSHDLLDILINGSTKYTDGATPAMCRLALEVRSPVGVRKRANAGRLIIKPYVDGVVTPNPCYWFYFPLAYPLVDMHLVYDATTQRVLHTVFHIFPVSQNCPRLWFMGDETLLPACV